MGAVLIFVRCIVLLAFLLIPAISLAADFSIASFRATGSQMWRTSFPIRGASELYYPHSATYTTLNFEKNLKHQQKLRIEVGFTSALNRARGSDSDWDYTKSNDYWYYGEFQTSGKSGFFTIDIIRKLNPHHEFIWGYSYHNNHYHMTDGRYFIDNYSSVDTLLPTLDSAYTMIYQGPQLGLISKFPLTDKLSLTSTIAYSPLALVQGQGWWNLRTMSFSHMGVGQILDASVGAEFIEKNRTFSIGYRYKYADLYQGWENISSAVSWDKAKFTLHGVFISSKMRF